MVSVVAGKGEDSSKRRLILILQSETALVHRSIAGRCRASSIVEHRASSIPHLQGLERVIASSGLAFR